MNEDKNIIKKVYMEIDNITISVFMSCEMAIEGLLKIE